MTSASRRALALGIALCALGAPRAARGDDTSVAAATVLFDEGVKLMDAKRYVEACPKLARSQELAPSGGTLLALAECHEKSGKPASAWLEYREAAIRAAAAGKRAAEASALDRAKSLEPRLPRLTITAPVRADGSTTEIVRDGVVVKRAELGVAVPVDPGKHEVAARAPRKRAWTRTVELAESMAIEVKIPPLEDDAPAVVGAVPPSAIEPHDEPSASAPGRTQRIAGVAVGSLGVAGIAVGSVFGFLAKSKNDAALTHCATAIDGVFRCDKTGLDLTSSAKSRATASTVFFVVGGLALAAGVVLFVTAPRASTSVSVAPVVGPGFAGTAANVVW